MKQGDFSTLAKDYVHRPGYSELILNVLGAYLSVEQPGFVVADIGAGTGKLTEMLCTQGCQGYAVEPNDAMRVEGIRALGHQAAFQWRQGTAEATSLPSESVDWVLMASAFHWTDQPKALSEFHRILKTDGHFTALWNPRHIEKSLLEQQIERLIQNQIPDLRRVSSGSQLCTGALNETLVASGHFHNLVFMEAEHEVIMDRQRYLGVWSSVNDIQAQAGPERFQRILDGIQELLGDLTQVVVPYRTRSWTVQKRKG